MKNNLIKSLLQHSLSPHCFKFFKGQVLLPTSFPEANGREMVDPVLVNIKYQKSLLLTSHPLHCFMFLWGQVLLPSYPEASSRRWQTLGW